MRAFIQVYFYDELDIHVHIAVPLDQPLTKLFVVWSDTVWFHLIIQWGW